MIYGVVCQTCGWTRSVPNHENHYQWAVFSHIGIHDAHKDHKLTWPVELDPQGVEGLSVGEIAIGQAYMRGYLAGSKYTATEVRKVLDSIPE